MKRACRIILPVVVLLLILPSISSAGLFKVIKVYDGDTFKAEGHDIIIKVRLAGIDTPETAKRKGEPGQPYSQQAKKHLTSLILNRTVDIKGYGLGPYNRILGVIYLEGKDINLEMLKKGLAEVYRGRLPKGFNAPPYWDAEREAKAAKRGMWSLGDKYISPREWRRMHKRK